MPKRSHTRSAASWILLLGIAGVAMPLRAACGQQQQQQQQQRIGEQQVAHAYAAFAHGSYGACRREAERLRDRLHTFLGDPTPDTLAAARAQWVAARQSYGETEVLRFYGGPIDDAADGPEPLLNAWPLDEAYVDVVRGGARGGILQDRERFPHLTAAVLTMANERGGEANVCVGWHAIEFLLWGQDFHADGPGRRSHTAFVDDADPDAARRREYLAVLVDLLVEQLRTLEQAWAPDEDNYRRRFVADPRTAVRRMLTGMVVLSGFELGGERMAVAYETQDQEDEHSCFSDTTLQDFVANQRGIVHVWSGSGAGMGGVGLRALAQRDEPELCKAIDARLAATTRAIAAIPAPFDQAILGDDEAPGRRALRTCIESLELQTDLLAALGLALGHDIPVKPSGN